MQQSLKGKSNKVLSAAMTQQMLTKQKENYGLGLSLGGREKVISFSHGGSNEGFKCIMFAYMETGQGAVVMTNGDRGSSLATEILRALGREYGWPEQPSNEKTLAPETPDLYPGYAGKYNVNGTTATITTQGGQLYLSAPPLGPNPVRLYPTLDSKFFILEDNLEVTFVKDAQGGVNEIQVRMGGGTITAKRIP